MPPRSNPLRSSSRGKETREVKTSNNRDNYLSISFRYFQNHDKLPAQSLENWHEDGRLLDMLNSLVHICQNNITDLQSSKKISLYGSFPDKKVNAFSLPTLPEKLSKSENWGTIRNVGGQLPRIAGFMRDNVFYIVYLDKNHQFYQSEK